MTAGGCFVLAASSMLPESNKESRDSSGSIFELYWLDPGLLKMGGLRTGKTQHFTLYSHLCSQSVEMFMPFISITVSVRFPIWQGTLPYMDIVSWRKSIVQTSLNFFIPAPRKPTGTFLVFPWVYQ